MALQSLLGLDKLTKKPPKKQVSICLGFIEALLSPETKAEEKKEIDEKLTHELDEIVQRFYGPKDQDRETKVQPSPREQQEVAEEIIAQDFISKTLIYLPILGFEARKKVVWIIQFVITNQKEQAVPYCLKHPKLFATLITCYENSDSKVVVSYANLLGTVIQNKDLCEFIFSDPTYVNPFFKYMESPTAGMDSFSTFKLLMTEHKGVPASDYIKKHYEGFFQLYNGLLQCNNFPTKVQAFQLLNELLCARINFDVMVRYINDIENLKLVMVALKGGRAQQTAVFHVLKIFVGNPRKSPEVASILKFNKENLISFVTKFEKEKEDPRLERDKEAMLEKLNEL